MSEIEGIVDHIVFRNEENGYSVFEFDTDDAPLTVVGNFAVLSEGEPLKLEGEFTTHPTYGTQFRAVSCVPMAPTSEIAMERYLGSGSIKGIGPAMASRIVRRFKEDTFRIIDEEPERLAEIKGISSKKAQEIGMRVAERRQIREAMVFLLEKGVSPAVALKIYNTYGDDLYGIINTNPYQLAEDIDGIGFKTADEIAMKNGFATDSEFRIRSGILYTLYLASLDGHTYLPADLLSLNTAEILRVDTEWITPLYMDLAIEKKIILVGNSVYSASNYHSEELSASLLSQLNLDYDVPDEELNAHIKATQHEEAIVFDGLQRDAIKSAARDGIFILTGGPGTGKTTTIKAIISFFENNQLDISLAAPTGRAAKRMTEATGREAKTIHRLLEVHGALNDHSTPMFERNEHNPLETDVVIIDEMSMVDIYLFHSLLKAISPGTRLILVGDANQLPSVGPGNVLRDLIKTGAFSTVCLTNIFRQDETSDIVLNAHKIQNDEPIVLDNKSRDFFIMQRYDAATITNVTISLIRDKLPKYVGAGPLDIQVLTPTRKGLLGVESLNRELQKALNPPDPRKKERAFGERIFREGDKVMQIKNDYQLPWEVKGPGGFAVNHGLGVFNGDMGIVRKVSEYAETITVEFDEGREVEYPFKCVDEIELAYAVTIHKSQGSEYPAVIIPLLPGPRPLMNKNLIYTAITRAKSCVVIVGDEKVFSAMCTNKSTSRRYSSLDKRILEII